MGQESVRITARQEFRLREKLDGILDLARPRPRQFSGAMMRLEKVAVWLDPQRATVKPSPVTARPNPELVHGLFVPSDVQIKNVKCWNQRSGWGFSEEDFAKLPPPPAWPDSPLVAVVLTPYLPDTPEVKGVQRTFDEHWAIAAARQRNSWRWDELLSDPEHLQLFPGITHEPGLRWEVVDLGANWDPKNDIAPLAVRSPERSPHAAILAAAAHHPVWVRQMDGVTIPYVWLSGYQVTVPGRSAWQHVPWLYWDRGSRQVQLSADLRDDCYGSTAVPARSGA